MVWQESDVDARRCRKRAGGRPGRNRIANAGNRSRAGRFVNNWTPRVIVEGRDGGDAMCTGIYVERHLSKYCPTQVLMTAFILDTCLADNNKKKFKGQNSLTTPPWKQIA